MMLKLPRYTYVALENLEHTTSTQLRGSSERFVVEHHVRQIVHGDSKSRTQYVK